MPSQHSCMKVRLIINPISGTRNKAGLDRLVAESLSPLGWEDRKSSRLNSSHSGE